jgi:type III restriction enzyme
MKELKNYQDKAVNKLISRSKELFRENIDKKTIIFQAPTWSGKTFMMSQYIEQLIQELEEDEKDLCFLWFSIWKWDLHIQSYKSLKNEFEWFPKCVLLEKEFFWTRTSIDKNEVVVVNWEKLYSKDNKTWEWKNTLMKDKETTNFRELLINTREEDKTIILIIDESHASSSWERAMEIRDEIVKPDLTIEMSATPVFIEWEYNEKVSVQANDVIEEWMIKKEIIINENLDDLDIEEKTSENLILEASYKKRLELSNLYKENNINITPLCLIQLPNWEEWDDKREKIEKFLAKKWINYDNEKLAVWMTWKENKINQEKETIVINNSMVEFLIFKTAIATGWDCPRAQILVRFREINSIQFEIQTIWRIIRMPEAYHYTNDILNKSFIYINTNNFEVKKEKFNLNIIKSIKVNRKDDIYNNLTLKSYYRNRVDFWDITSSFTPILEDIFCKYFWLEKDNFDLWIYDRNKKKMNKKWINLDWYDNQDEIILNMEIDIKEFDQLVDKKIKKWQSLNLSLSQNDMEYAFINLIKANLNWFASKRSLWPVQTAIFVWFQKYLWTRKNQQYEAIYVMNVVLNNYKTFAQLIDESIKKYKPLKNIELKKRMKEVEQWDEKWQISESRNFNPYSYTEYRDYSKNIYKPCYLNLDNNLEREFSDYLEENKDKISWWWQNWNEHMALNFWIKYWDFSTFQPDFIIMFNDWRIWIFDTKASWDREDQNKIKAKALQKYIIEEKKKWKDIFWWIIIKSWDHFLINSDIEYIPFNENIVSEPWISYNWKMSWWHYFL